MSILPSRVQNGTERSHGPEEKLNGAGPRTKRGILSLGGVGRRRSWPAAVGGSPLRPQRKHNFLVAKIFCSDRSTQFLRLGTFLVEKQR